MPNRSVSDNPKGDEESSTLHQYHYYLPEQSCSEPRLDEHEQREEGGGKGSAHETDEEDEKLEQEETEKGLKQLSQDESDDSERSPYSSSSEKPEFVFVELSNIRDDVQCPICLGIIRKTRTVMECLHRFCRECIDKSMRMGNNECPAFRTHCASRQSLRDDPNYDALIAALYPNIDKYEEEELAFHEEERTRNKQIQASIAQIFQRQSQALIKRHTVGKDRSDIYMTRAQLNHWNVCTRRGNSQGVEPQGFEDNDDENENNNICKDSSSTEDHCTEFRKRKHMKRGGVCSSQTSFSVANSGGGCSENDLEMGRENLGIYPGFAWNTEMLAWGKGGVRSHTRHGNGNGCSNKIYRSSRLSKLVDYLRSLKENADEYIACQTLIQAKEIELLVPKRVFQFVNDQSNTQTSTAMENPDLMSLMINSCRHANFESRRNSGRNESQLHFN